MTVRLRKDIVKQFNATVHSIIKKIEQKTRKEIEVANLDRLRKRINLLTSTAGDDALLVESSPFFIEFREKILEPNQDHREKFFMTMDIRTEYLKHKKEVQKEDEFVFALTDSIREHYKRISQVEKDQIYVEVVSLFQCCIEYQIAKK